MICVREGSLEMGAWPQGCVKGPLGRPAVTVGACEDNAELLASTWKTAQPF